MNPGWLKAIAVLEIVGGVCGTASVAYFLILRAPTPGEIGLAAVLIGLYLFGLFAGVMLWRGTRVGRVTSIVAQLVQLPKVLSPALAFMMSYGLDFTVMALSNPGRGGHELSFNVWGPSHHLVLVGAEGLRAGFGVSVVSLFALWLLRRSGATAAPTVSTAPRAEPAPLLVTPPASSDGQPEWVMSRGFVLVVGVLLLVVAVCGLCAGLPGPRR